MPDLSRSASCLVIARCYPHRMEQPVKSWHSCFGVRHVSEFTAQSPPRLDCLSAVHLLRLCQHHFHLVFSVFSRTPNQALQRTGASLGFCGVSWHINRHWLCAPVAELGCSAISVVHQRRTGSSVSLFRIGWPVSIVSVSFEPYSPSRCSSRSSSPSIPCHR